MSIIHQSDTCWVIDHESFLNNTYSSCLNHRPTNIIPKDEICDREIRQSFTVKESLFDIYEPFLMDSNYLKKKRDEEEKERTDSNGESCGQRSKKKRKTVKGGQGDSSEEFKAYLSRRSELEGRLVSQSKEIIEFCQGEGYYKKKMNRNRSNNAEARECARDIEQCGPPFRDWCRMARDFSADGTEYVDLSKDYVGRNVPSVINTFMGNSSPHTIVRELLGEQYLLPPHSTFLMSDISTLQNLLAGMEYDVIVMDPPWTNKSVRRKKMYEEMEVEKLLQIPPVLVAGGILVVWTTNKLIHQEFILQKLFPRWGAKHVATWHWLKVTKLGEYITDMTDIHGKRPYETILIGQVDPTDNATRESVKRDPDPHSLISGENIAVEVQGDGSLTPSSTVPVHPGTGASGDTCPVHVQSETGVIQGCCNRDVKSPVTALPDQRIVISVPSSLHSSKPPLCDLLRPHLPDSPRCLELFARNLLPNWTSWGNEALKFQNINCFQQINDSSNELLS